MGIISGGFAIVVDFRSDILCLPFGVEKFGGKYSYSNDIEFSVLMKLVWPIEMLKSPVESLFR